MKIFTPLLQGIILRTKPTFYDWILRTFILLVFIWGNNLNAQSQKEQIKIINSDQLTVVPNSLAKKLIGHVVLEHNNAIMSCDSAYLFDLENKFEAFNHVKIIQGDSMSLNSDHLVYNGSSKIAHTDGNVLLIQKGMSIATDRLDYDMNLKVADYQNHAKIMNGENTLYSQIGQYNSNIKELYFKKNVILINPKYTMYTDTMRFATIKEIAYFFGPTNIITKNNDSIYCENGWYNTKKDFAQFSKNSKLISGSQKISADSMTYDQIKSVGKGYRNIIFSDVAEKINLLGNYGEYYQKSRSAFITGQAIAIQIVDSDSVYTHADTLRYIGDTSAQSNKLFLAYNHVKIFKKDIQSASDSMSYSLSDSIIRLYKNPIMWNKENQLTADTIYIYQKNQKVDNIELINKAFICSHEKGNHYNQIKGKKIIGYFDNGELYNIRVQIDGESIYYIKEDSNHYTGINQISCQQMTIYLTNQKVSGIKFYTENKGTIHPVANANASLLKLRGFKWQSQRRPLNPMDVLK